MARDWVQMPAAEFFTRAERYFQYLCDKHDFHVSTREVTDHFDVCEIAWKSPVWQIRVGRERGAVYIYLGSSSAPDIWFGLGTVITFLQRGTDQVEKIWFGPGPDWSLDYDTRLDRQLRWYADALHPHPASITAVFGADELGQNQAELVAWQRHKEEQARQALTEGKFPT